MNLEIFCKLLYESFIFYGSKNNKIKLLYHEMTQKLSFQTLYCFFDSPTSTTFEPSVAQQFCKTDGIILKFDSGESETYIKTLNMALFSAFDSEREHLIFDRDKTENPRYSSSE